MCYENTCENACMRGKCSSYVSLTADLDDRGSLICQDVQFIACARVGKWLLQ